MLGEYKRKRSFDATPEPSGDSKKKTNARTKKDNDLIFVIQKHAARRLHYDFRLEVDGVLVSFAVPKGPSTDPAEKRLAVMTEDHPMDYAQFEGVIPPKQYGAGKVEIWDHGTYSPDEDGQVNWGDKEAGNKRMRAALKKGKLSFTLHGKRLNGSWTLVRMKTNEAKPQWLLIKHKEEAENTELKVKAKAKTRRGTASKTSKKSKPLEIIPPMLATLADEPFSKEDWSFEPKFDGYRVISYIDDGQVKLMSRNGIDMTEMFAPVVEELQGIKSSVILDGEMMAFDAQGKPSFQALQRAFKEKSAPPRIMYFVFDSLHFEEADLLDLPLRDRRKALVRLFKNYFPAPSLVSRVESLGSDGEVAFQAALANGMEGVVGKSLESTYQPGNRSKSWLKVKATKTDEFLICGYNAGQGNRTKTFSSLVLGQYDKEGKIVYCGNVGTGFTEKSLQALLKQLKPLVRKTAPLSPDMMPAKSKREKTTWVKPFLVAEVKFGERTQDNILRAPVFLHLRDDIEPKTVAPKKTAKENAKKKPAELDIPGLSLTNLDKVLWPAQGRIKAVTKGAYLDYLEQVADYLLPHLKDRAITLVRYPNGIDGTRFYQKHWEKNLPDFVESALIYTEHEKRDQRFLLCNNRETLLWFAQIADLELHTSHTRVSNEPDAQDISENMTGSAARLDKSIFNYPDFIVFDLDPYLYSGKEGKGAEPELHKKGFQATVKAARLFKDLLDELGLESFIKTSGKTGLHIFVPIVRNIDYDTVRDIAQKVCASILARHSEILTMDWAVKKRPGKVFLDHNMNARGKSLASIFSPRAVAGAFVSMPLDWQELDKVYPTDFNIWTVPGLLDKRGDKWKEILDHKNDLQSSFQRKLKKAV